MSREAIEFMRPRTNSIQTGRIYFDFYIRTNKHAHANTAEWQTY